MNRPDSAQGLLLGHLVWLIAILPLASAVGCSESPAEYAARDARYQVAKKECADAASKRALSGSRFTQAKADKALAETVSCLRSRGFDVSAR
jgi:hypothetical protein